jgi:hypothetical protein
MLVFAILKGFRDDWQQQFSMPQPSMQDGSMEVNLQTLARNFDVLITRVSAIMKETNWRTHE